MLNMECPFCQNEAQWVENKKIYGRNYGKSYMAYYCKPCDAYVGCHKNSKTPLGTMADKETRMWRRKAHCAFDYFWKSGKMSRGKMYRNASEHFGKQVHIGESDIEQCKQIIDYATNL